DQQHHADNGGGEKQVKFGPLALLDAGQVMGDGQDQEEAQGQGELEDLAEKVNPVGVKEQEPLLKEAGGGQQQPHRGQSQGDPVVGLDPGRSPEAKAEKDQGQAQIIEFRSEQHHIHGHIPWRNGITAVLIVPTISCGKNPKRIRTLMRIMRGKPRKGLTSSKWTNLGFGSLKKGFCTTRKAKRAPTTRAAMASSPCTG